MSAEAWERRREPREAWESGPDGTGKRISAEQSGEVPGTRKQPESVKRVKNIQNPQFHWVGRHMAYHREMVNVVHALLLGKLTVVSSHTM